MVHRKQAIDVVGLIAQLAGFIVLISLFFPAVRRALTGLGLIAVGLLILFVMGLIGFSFYRLFARQGKAVAENPFAPPSGISIQTGNDGGSKMGSDDASEPASKRLDPALRRRYPWRHEVADHP